MNPSILNREFQHPADGWYQIEALGEHPNRAAGVVQVIDQDAAASIADRFNQDAETGRLRHGNEMLIDHEHFSDQPDQETRAYGWLQELQSRPDGLYGRIRWTGTGKAAVDGGDYRFFSTEYEPADLQVLNDSQVRRVRPLRLSGLTLTNMHNNRGQKPITNRSLTSLVSLPSLSTLSNKEVNATGTLNDEAGSVPAALAATNLAGSPEPADATKTKNRNTQPMKDIAKLLGLSEDAAPEAVSAEITKLKNRAADFEAANQALVTEQMDSLLAEHGIRDEQAGNRLKLVLANLKNRAERASFLSDCGFSANSVNRAEASAKAGAASAVRVLNRGTGAVRETSPEIDDQALTEKIKNRAQELKGATPARTFDSCWQQAQREALTKKS